MTERPLDPWMTNAPGPFLTMNPGGPLRGRVMISVATKGEQLLLVEATWKPLDGGPRSASATIDGYDEAQMVAHRWADQLAAGREPTS